ncbi:glycosyltransferase family 4 protein [Actinomyces bowdenii]|uniref:glycosyltransferase family 4 protein n=1 Tax=Actinomyces bowdenii TaxID=131109 RepID=UPI001ABBFC13|nr:glycosyltransferase family 4 protein [Actinomyces bowdenii]MBO3725296.1 glycosyltransferase family 4 protein [Actinomyces bowdenii]
MTRFRRGGALLATRIHLPEAAAASFRLDGVERALARHGVPVRVLTTTVPGRDGAPAPQVQDPPGVSVSRWPALRDESGYLRGYLPYLSFDVPLLLRLGLAPRPDVVLVEPPPTTGVVARTICALRRTPYVWYAPDVWSEAVASTGAPGIVARAVRSAEACAVRGARAVIAVNEEVAERVRALGARRVVVIPNGIDTSLFEPTGPTPSLAEREALGITGPYLVYAGTASEWQGAGIFVQALARARRTHPGAQALFIGQGSDWEAIARAAAALPPGPDGAPAVVMHDLMAPQDAARWQRGAAAALVSIRPGQGYDFAYPTKVLAALACGTPVVYAGVGPVRADLEDASLGWAAAYEPDDVARALSLALDQDAACEADGGQGRRDRAERLHAWVRAHRSLEATGESVARRLREVVRG